MWYAAGMGAVHVALQKHQMRINFSVRFSLPARHWLLAINLQKYQIARRQFLSRSAAKKNQTIFLVDSFAITNASITSSTSPAIYSSQIEWNGCAASKDLVWDFPMPFRALSERPSSNPNWWANFQRLQSIQPVCRKINGNSNGVIFINVGNFSVILTHFIVLI